MGVKGSVSCVVLVGRGVSSEGVEKSEKRERVREGGKRNEKM